MIASYSHNFIFLKTIKTGGTSVEAVLSTWCSGKDVVTPFAPADEVKRAEMGGRPMNFRRGWFRRNFYQHTRAEIVRRYVPGLWSRAFKFTVERHPYERAVSLAYWRIHARGGDPASEYAREIDVVLGGIDGFNNRRIYCIDDKIAVDEVIRYDNLWTRLGEIAASLGCELPRQLPQTKTSSRLDPRPAREILTDAQKARIFELRRLDFEELGFEP